jgi:tetratricopeptide (TPR) repeat protein
LTLARALNAANDKAAARLKLAEAASELGRDATLLADLATEIETFRADLDRFEQFQTLIDRGYRVESGTRQLDLKGEVPRGSAKEQRQSARTAPLLYRALALYGILDRDDWATSLEGCALSRDQVQQVRRTAYEALLWLAHDAVIRGHDHRSGENLAPKDASAQALAYLARAATAHRPTRAFHSLSCLCHQARGDETAAKADRQRAQQTAPALAVDHYLWGRAALQSQDRAAAIKAFEAALDLEPTHYWSLMRLGCCLCDLGRGPQDFTQAVAAFRGCILKRPDDGHAHYCLANALRRLGRDREALASYTRAIDLYPAHVSAWNNRGYLYLNLGELKKAAADFSRAIDLDPNHAPAWAGRGLVSANRDPEQALADLSRAIALNANYTSAWYNRGNVHLRANRLARALADFSRAIALNENYAEAWCNRGSTRNRMGKPDMALTDLSRAIKLDAKLAVAWTERGNAYLKMNQPARAVDDFTAAIALDEKIVQAWFGRANAYTQLRQPARALADLDRTLELDPNNARAWNCRGVTHGELRQHEQAIEDFSQAIHRDPKLAAAWNNRGGSYLVLGQPARAVADFSAALKLDENYLNALGGRGSAYLLLGKPDRALPDLSRAITLAQKHPRVSQLYLLRAQAHRQQAHYPEARADGEKAVRLAPANARAHNDLAWLLATCPEARFRDPKEAVAHAERAVELSPKTADFRSTLGVARYRMGDGKAAIAGLGTAVELRSPSDLSAGCVDAFFLAMVHEQQGNRPEARKWFDRGVEWLEKGRERLARDPTRAEELRRFRREAEEVLEPKK